MGLVELAPLVSALETLQAQHKAVLADEQQIKAELEILRAVRGNLETAMRSLETLVTDPSTWESRYPTDRTLTTVTVRPAAPSELLDNAVAEVRKGEAPPPVLAPYVPAVGGKRLKSKRMLFDLLRSMKEPVTRDQLRHLFFQHYGRQNLERYWVRPDNALNTAIDRAVAEHLIEEAQPKDGGPALYFAGWADSATGEPAFPDNEEDDD